MSVNDQYEHGRIPLKPLPYNNRNLSQCNEIMVDYGENANYHIYITHHSDPTKYIDITALIVKEMLPKAEINANQFTITIEGESNPQSLMDVINFIYKRFTYSDDPSGFNYLRDYDKLFGDNTINVLLQTTDGTIQLPITTADNVYDKNGSSIQQRLDNMVKLGFSVTYLYTEEDNQTTYEFEYPFEDYPDLLEVRIGTTYVDKSRYSITNHYDAERHFKTGTLTFIGESIEIGRRIDLVWIFNASYDASGKLEFMPGTRIADSTLPITKLEKYSNSYSYADGSSVATSKALADLYTDLIGAINANNKSMYYCNDTSSTSNTISVDVSPISENDIIVVTLSSDKTSNVKLSVGGGSFSIVTPDGNSLVKGFKNNQILRLKISNNKAILLSGLSNEIRNNKYIHDCVDQEYTISFAGLAYYTGDLIHIYRNGVRLFQDLDYSVNNSDETITLFVRTEQGERIVFEALGL